MGSRISFLQGHAAPADYSSPCVWLIESASPERDVRHHAGLVVAAYLERGDVRLTTRDDTTLFVPDAPEVSIGVAYAGRWVAVGLTPVGRIGVHAEAVSWEMGLGTLAESYFTPRESELVRAVAEDEQRREFYRFWTGKQAVLKVLGAKLGLEQVEIGRGESGYEVVRVGERDGAGWTLGHRVVESNPPVVVAVAVGEAAA
jgi:hypothetical protein